MDGIHCILFQKKFYVYQFQRIYCANIHCLKKLDSVSKAPLHEHFYETTRGLLTIRSTGQDGLYIEKCDKLIDDSQKAHYLLQAAFRYKHLYELFFVSIVASKTGRVSKKHG